MGDKKIYRLVVLTPDVSNRDSEGELVYDRDRILEQADYPRDQTFDDLAKAKAAADAVFAAVPDQVIVHVERVPSDATDWKGGCVYRLPKR